ncbi:hypothetical protein M2106_002072 [Paenibacillus sp. PastF-2]|nr:hypothetical protein [Paenibacillus sp. PastF-2]
MKNKFWERLFTWLSFASTLTIVILAFFYTLD